MFTYDLDKNLSVPMYLQLYNCIKSDLLNGTIGPREKLPSKRSLSKHLNISIITVQSAYDQLAAEGYIYSKERSGYFACELQEGPVPLSRIRHISSPPPEDNIPGDNIFPFNTWAKLSRRVIMERSPSFSRHLEWNGAYDLREAISAYLQDFRGMKVSPEQIIIGAGTEYLYSLIIQLLGRDRIYAIEDPGYPKLRSILSANDVQYRNIPVNAQGMDVDKLRSADAQIIHISPAHHFPTGAVMPITRRQELLKWAGTERYIIEDDYDSEFRFKGKPIPTLFSTDSCDRVIYTNTFSKTISPSIRISYMVLPGALLDEYRKKLSFYSCTVSAFEQYTLAKFITEGYFERHINRAKKHYRRKRDTVIQLLLKELDLKEEAVSQEDAGLNFLLTIDDNKKIDKLKDLAERFNLKLADMDSYCAVKTDIYKNVIVVGYQDATIKDC